MSTKTGTQIENDILQLFVVSVLKVTPTGQANLKITGDFYKWGTRPTREQTLEDAVVKFSAGDGFQIQQGIVRMNIYVNDISNGTATKVLDTARAAAIEAAAFSALNTIRSNNTEYNLRLASIPQTYEDAPGTGQHYINFKINFSRIII